MENKIVIGGFISVKSVIEAKSRKIYKVFFEKSRYDSIMRSELRVPEKRQYEGIIRAGLDIEYLDDAAFNELCGGNTSGGIAAQVGERIFTPEERILDLPEGYIAALDGIEDPFNFAYSLRSLYAAGCDAVLVPKRNFFTASDVVIRSSAGASERMTVCECEDIAVTLRALRAKGYSIACTAKTENAKDLYRAELKRPICLVFGGEKRGIKQEIIELSDTVIKIRYPRDCHYSLPACSAVSIISFECARKLAKSSRPH